MVCLMHSAHAVDVGSIGLKQPRQGFAETSRNIRPCLWNTACIPHTARMSQTHQVQDQMVAAAEVVTSTCDERWTTTWAWAKDGLSPKNLASAKLMMFSTCSKHRALNLTPQLVINKYCCQVGWLSDCSPMAFLCEICSPVNLEEQAMSLCH